MSATFQVVGASLKWTPSAATTQPTASKIYFSGHEAPSSSQPDAMEIELDDTYMDTTEAYDDGGATRDYDNEEGDEDLHGGKRIATTGETIASAESFMRGHGSYLATLPSSSSDTGTVMILSSLLGTVSRTNKLVSVHAVRQRYAPEVGDLVVGRITDVAAGARRWKVDIASRQDAVLSLSSVNLPGGVQRRKLESDELQMRAFFQERDLLVAEVQTAFADGSVGLHTRSLRYGKLRNGALVVVPALLVQRLKSHFVHLPNADVDLTLGLNGYVWVSKHIKFDAAKAEAEASGNAGGNTEKGSHSHHDEASGLGGHGIGRDIDGVYSDVNEYIPFATRQRISRVCSVLILLAEYHIPINDISISRAFDASVELVPLHLHSDNEENAANVVTESALCRELGRAVVDAVVASGAVQATRR